MRGRADGPVLPGYSRTLFLQRHRWLGLLAIFVAMFGYGAAWALFGQRGLLPLLVLPLILLAIILWLLPDTAPAPKRALGGWLMAYLIALFGWPDYLAIALPGLPWITLLRLVGVPMTLAFLAYLAASGAMRARLVQILSGSPLIWKGVLAFSFIGFYSIALSHAPAASLQRYLIAQINWTAVFFIACYVFMAPHAMRRFTIVLWVALIFICAIAFYEARYQRLPWVGHIPWFLAVQDESVQRVLAGTVRAGSTRFRSQSKFTTSLGLAEFLAMSAPFIFHYAFNARRMIVRLLGWATVVVILFAVNATDSRLAAIGLFFSLTLSLFYWAYRRWQSHPGGLIGPLVVMIYPVAFMAMVSATFLVGRIRARIWGDGSQNASNEARRTMFANGIPLIIRNPLGYGFGQGAVTLDYHSPAGRLTIDSYYLAAALEFGVIGFVVYFGMFLIAIWQSTRIALWGKIEDRDWLAPLAIALFDFFLSKSIFSNFENHPLAFAMLGMVVAFAYREQLLRNTSGPVKLRLAQHDGRARPALTGTA